MKTNKVDPCSLDDDGSKSINKTRIGNFNTLEGGIEDHKALCKQREEEIKAIIMEGKCLIPWWKSLWMFVGSILGCASTLAGFVLWPTDNVFIFPDKWWQCMIQCAFIWNGILTFFMVSNTAIWIDSPQFLTIKAFMYCYSWSAISSAGCWVVYSALWCFGLGLPYPPPHVGIPAAVCCTLAITINIWFSFPKSWRKETSFKKRGVFLTIGNMYFWILFFFYCAFILFLFDVTPIDYQWGIVILLILVREFGAIALDKITHQMCGFEHYSLELIGNNLGGTYYGLFLSLVVSNLATDFTAYLLVGFDCIVNMYFLIKAVKLKRKVDRMEDSDEKKEETVDDLVVSVQLLLLAESSEIVLPLAYLLCFTAAFYGPNALQLGNVRNSYWLYKEVDDIVEGAVKLLVLVAFDCCTLTVTVITMACNKINLWKVFLHLMKEYGLAFAAQQAYIIATCFCTVQVACALDFTFKFEWITNREEWYNINVYKNLTEESLLTNMTTTEAPIL